MVDRKIRVVFGVPFAYAGVLAAAYGYFINSPYGYGLTGLASAAITLFVFLVLHAAIYRRLSRSASCQAAEACSPD